MTNTDSNKYNLIVYSSDNHLILADSVAQIYYNITLILSIDITSILCVIKFNPLSCYGLLRSYIFYQ